MWNYTKCTAQNREKKLAQLTESFRREADCINYLTEVQDDINSVQTTVVLLQDLDANVMIEMDYVPVNDYVFHVISIEDNGIRTQSVPCRTILQAVEQFQRLVSL